MESTMDGSLDFDEFINWPDDLPPVHDAAGGEEGRRSNPVEIQASFGNATFGHAQPLAQVVPGYSANEANEDTDHVTTDLTPAQEGVDTPSSGQASSSTNHSKQCACIVCRGIGVYDSINHGPEQCHFVSCSWTSLYETLDRDLFKHEIAHDRAAHAKTHYQQGQGPKKNQLYHCLVEDCRFKSNRWSDLQRHTTTKHCSNPVKFECSVIGCKFNGEGNGFTRKDKLAAHYESMHRGQRVPGLVARTLQPAPASSHAEASGSSSIGA